MLPFHYSLVLLDNEWIAGRKIQPLDYTLPLQKPYNNCEVEMVVICQRGHVPLPLFIVTDIKHNHPIAHLLVPMRISSAQRILGKTQVLATIMAR